MYSLVIPVYKNAPTIPDLVQSIESMHEQLDRLLEVVFVVDGSPDDSYRLLQSALPGCSFPAELIALSRNFGSFAAIRMGLSAAKGPFFAVMAADLQEPPELVVEFFRSLRNEPFDVALGVRTSREDPLLSRLSSATFWALYRRLVQRDMPAGGVDVFACNLTVQGALLRLSESNSSLVGLLLWLGFRRKLVPYKRRKRPAGKSGWTLRRKLRYLLDSSFAFTDLPISLLMLVGVAGTVFATVVGTIVFLAWWAGSIKQPGYTPIILTIMLFSSLILTAQGVIGSYVWRAFENTKQRPAFLPMMRESFRKERLP